MKIFVEFIGKLAKQTEPSAFFIYLNDGATIKDLLKKLKEDKKVNVSMKNGEVLILLNGHRIEAVDTKLEDSDKVTIAPVVYGG